MIGGFQVVCAHIGNWLGNILIYTLIENPICLSHFSAGTVVNQPEILLVDWNEWVFSVVVVVVYTYTSGMLYWGLGLLLGRYKNYLFLLFIEWKLT